MNATPENPIFENESNPHSAITRRSFIKKTTATTLLTILAIESFRSELNAAEGGGSSSEKTKYILAMTGGGSPMVETKGDHPWHYDPEQQDNGYRIWKTHTGGWFRVKEPTPESNSWMEMQIIGQSRPTQSYTESLFPNTTDIWGYYSTSLDFSWEIKIEIWRRTIVHDEITGQDDVGSPVLQSTFPFDHLGNVSIDPNSGKITLSPKPPNILKLVDSGNMGPCEYKVKMIKEPSSFGIYVYVWKSHDGDPVPPGEQPAGGIGLTDFFTWSVKEYMVPQ